MTQQLVARDVTDHFAQRCLRAAQLESRKLPLFRGQLADGGIQLLRAPLQRIQIIKGWVDDEGALHEEVVDVAGGPNDASVDPATCAPTGTGARELCGVWRDPAFDAELAAVYYARVVENPSCRYSAWRCSALPEAERPAGCRHERMSPVQQERAWTSPIWVRRGSDDEPERAPRASKRKKNRAKRKPPSEEGGPS